MFEFLKIFYIALGILFNIIMLIVLVYACIYIHRTNKERNKNFHVMKSRKNYYDYISDRIVDKCSRCKHNNEGFNTKNCHYCINIEGEKPIYKNFEEV
jgi:hypothetical protein